MKTHCFLRPPISKALESKKSAQKALHETARRHPPPSTPGFANFGGFFDFGPNYKALPIGIYIYIGIICFI